MKKYLISIILTVSLTAFCQTGKIKGTVQAMDGKAIESASVSIKGTSSGTASDQKGEYSLNVPVGNQMVVVSIIGYANQEQSVDVRNGEIYELNFSLVEASQELNEVIISGVRAITGMGYLAEASDYVIYSGKKTEVLLLDSLGMEWRSIKLGRDPSCKVCGIGVSASSPSQGED